MKNKIPKNDRLPIKILVPEWPDVDIYKCKFSIKDRLTVLDMKAAGAIHVESSRISHAILCQRDKSA